MLSSLANIRFTYTSSVYGEKNHKLNLKFYFLKRATTVHTFKETESFS